jgi:Rubredoxin-like zinc ribbon domain (DUF35_N)
MSPLVVQRCAPCGLAVFPPRLLCPRCGAMRWDRATLDQGRIEDVTDLPDAPPLLTVRAAAGPMVMARGRPGLEAGDLVRLSRAPDGAVRADPAQD